MMFGNASTGTRPGGAVWAERALKWCNRPSTASREGGGDGDGGGLHEGRWLDQSAAWQALLQ
jgi:hypothetical protein